MITDPYGKMDLSPKQQELPKSQQILHQLSFFSCEREDIPRSERTTITVMYRPHKLYHVILGFQLGYMEPKLEADGDVQSGKPI